MRTKTCTKCGEEKSIEHFGKSASGYRGVRADCVLCHRAAVRRCHAENKEAYKERTRAYKEENREVLMQKDREAHRRAREDPEKKARFDARNKVWREANKEYVKAKNLAYYEANKETFKKNVRAYLDANPDKAKAWAQNYRARRRAGGLLTGEQVRAVLDLWDRCIYCDRVFDENCRKTLDHVRPLTQGGTNDPVNLVACCHRCNCRKKHRLLSEWVPPIGIAAVVKKIEAALDR